MKLKKTFSTSKEYPFLKPLETKFPDIKKEILNTTGIAIRWPEKEIHNGLWYVSGVLAPPESGSNWAPISNYPILEKTVKYIGPATALGVSTLNSGGEIYPHTGYSGDVIRVHLPIYVPSNNYSLCGIKVGNEISSWVEGKVLAFDDTMRHSAWNKTNVPRIVVIVDFRKELFQ